ncbi:zinc finger domain-containing protein [Sphingobium agri]
MSEEQPRQRRRLRMEAMRVHCPVCGAFPQQPCVGRRGGARVAIHLDRYEIGAPSA